MWGFLVSGLYQTYKLSQNDYAKDSIFESFCYDKGMFNKLSRNQYVLLIISLALLVSYYIFWRNFNLSEVLNPISVNLAILLIILPLLLISIIPSYVISRTVKIKKPSLYVKVTLFSLTYIIVAFVSVSVLVALGL